MSIDNTLINKNQIPMDKKDVKTLDRNGGYTSEISVQHTLSTREVEDAHTGLVYLQHGLI